MNRDGNPEVPNYLFSEFTSSEFNELHKQIARILDISKDQFRSIYDAMRRDFCMEKFPLENRLDRTIFFSEDPDFQKQYNNAFVVQVDIPSLLENDDSVENKKTVVILGQDPYRETPKRLEGVGIGTPYAMHLRFCREQLHTTKLYFDLIKMLLNKGFRVYLTDIFKIWVSEADRDKAIPLSKKDLSRFETVLKAEMEIIQPTAIVTWGKVSTKAFQTLGFDLPHLECPHPSGAANGAWKKRMGKPATRENKLIFWEEEIVTSLLSL